MEEYYRRVASNEVIVDETVIRQCVVEIMNGRVVNYYHFQDELPLTEWLGGTIRLIKDKDGVLRAYQNGNRL